MEGGENMVFSFESVEDEVAKKMFKDTVLGVNNNNNNNGN